MVKWADGYLMNRPGWKTKKRPRRRAPHRACKAVGRLVVVGVLFFGLIRGDRRRVFRHLGLGHDN